MELYGIVDRIDEVDDDGEPVLELIDYKAGSADPLEGAGQARLRRHAARLLCGAGGRGDRQAGAGGLSAARGARGTRHRAAQGGGGERPRADRRRRRSTSRGCAAARRCARWARARCASGATCAASAVATTGRPRSRSRRLPGRRPDDERRPGPAGRRRAGLAGSLLRHRLRPGDAASWSRPAPARARPGCWCRASLRALLDGVAAARDPRHHLHPRRRRRDARAARRVARRMVDAAPSVEAARRARSGMRGVGPDDAVRLEPALRALAWPPARQPGGRSQMRTFHAWFVQLLRARAAGDARVGSACSADMSLIEDVVDLRAPVFRAFHAAVLRDPALRADYGAMVATRGRHMLDLWLGRAWQRRMEIRPGRRGRHARGQRRAGCGVVGRARGHGRPGAAGRRRRWRERLLALAAASAAAQEQDAARRRRRDRRGATRCRRRARASRRLIRRCSPETARRARTCPSRRRWPRPASSLSRLHEQVAPARRPARAPAHGPARARAARRARRPQAAHGFADMADLERLRARAAARRRPRRLGAGAARRCACATC